MRRIFKREADDVVVIASEVTPAPGVESDVARDSAPLEILGAHGICIGRVKVDACHCVDDCLVVYGWTTGDVDLALEPVSGSESMSVLRFERKDVALHFGEPCSRRHGMALVRPMSEAQALPALHWRCGDEAGSMAIEVLPTPEDLTDTPWLGQVAHMLALRQRLLGARWRALVTASVPRSEVGARGWVESAVHFRGSGCLALTGWKIVPEGVAWVEDDQGRQYAFDQVALRHRPDVLEATGAEFGPASLESGFIALIDVGTSSPSRLMLKALTPKGVAQLHACDVTTMPADPKAASRWLFGISAHEGELAERFERIGFPLISRLTEHVRAHRKGMPVTHCRLGSPCAAPHVSIIVPLYGRFDFVEDQMVEWAADSWIRRHAQLIYVVDDPAVADAFRSHAVQLHQLYGVSFEWVWGGVNRGFSGANNLGTQFAIAPRLLFLNSDVFPRKPGWAEALVAVLDEDPTIGAVGPRLLFPEGGIQHAGMQFRRLDSHGVWINQHVAMGLDPSLDPARGLTEVHAVTGACLAMRTSDFHAIHGWDEGYLIGDFEDSDLCMKLRALGRKIAYLPSVELTHLERQSMPAIGDGSYRMRVTLWNALRHQARWGAEIDAMTKASA